VEKIQKKRAALYSFMTLLVIFNLCFGQSVWEPKTFLPQGDTLHYIAYGDSMFVAVGTNGCMVTSLNGITWETITSAVTSNLSSITYGNTRFVVAGDSGIILTSSNGTTFGTRTSGVTSGLSSVTYGNDRFVVVGDSGIILTSSDGTTWEKQISGVTTDLSSVTYGKKQYVAVGNYGRILTSPDGIVWTTKTSGITTNLSSVSYGADLFVAVGGYKSGMIEYTGTILSSPEGTTWTKSNAIILSNLNCVIFADNQFVVVGSIGAIASSPDGMVWKLVSETGSWLTSVAFGNNTFMAVGNNGALLTSIADKVRSAQSDSKSGVNKRFYLSFINNRIFAMLPNTLAHKQITVRILSVSGKTMYSSITAIYNGVLIVPSVELPNGTYFLSISQNNSVTVSLPFFSMR
jgi:hypothetical protein